MEFKTVNEIKSILKEKCASLKMLISENSDMNLNQSMIEKIDEFVKEFEQWRYCIYMIGEFSCGKSSLLNAFLQKPNLLPKANTAETAVTTEICYGPENRVTYCYLNDAEETEDNYDDRVAEKIRQLGNDRKLKKVVLQLNLPVLKKYEELSFVDMPGLSSTNVAHEESLNRFIQEGGLGLICVAMKNGNVHSSLLNFLRRTNSYHYECNVVLTKMDDCPSAERDSVRNKIVSTIEENLGISVDSAMVSTYDASLDISEFEAMIEKLSADQTEYFLNRFNQRFQELVSESAAPIVIALREKYSDGNLDEMIQKVQMEIDNLPSFFNDLSMDMEHSARQIVDKTLSYARMVLSSGASEYIQSAKAGMNISTEVRSSLNTAIQSKLREELDDMTRRIVDRAREKLENVMEVPHDEAYVDVGGWTPERANSGSGHPIAGAAVGVVSGAAAGAAIGSIVPVIGTTVGAVIGGIIGLLGGAVAGSSIDRNSEVESKVEEYLDNCIEQARSSVERICLAAIEKIKTSVNEGVSYRIQAYKNQLESLRQEKLAGENEFKEKQIRRAEIKARFDDLAQF